MTIIDAHASFRRGQPPSRDYAPADLEPRLAAIGGRSMIAVQADPGVNFGDWLLGSAARHDSVAAVVCRIPLENPQVGGELDWLADQPKLRGVFALARDAGVPGWEAGLDELVRLGLVCDLDIAGCDLPGVTGLVDRHPQQRFVLTHMARPPLATDALEPWRTQLRELGRRPNVSCKIAGLPGSEVAERMRHEARMWPFYDTALTAFGPERLMFGSDWPVSVHDVAAYSGWFERVEMWIEVLTESEQARVLAGTAAEVYRL